MRTGSSSQLSWEHDVDHDYSEYDVDDVDHDYSDDDDVDEDADDYSDDDVDEDDDDLTGWLFPNCPESSSWPRRRARCRSSPPPG